MVVFGFDVGHKKTGVAIGNLLTGHARPLTTITGGRTQQLQRAAEQIKVWRPRRLIIGLPKHMDGKEHAMSKNARVFARLLGESCGLPVSFCDERLSTDAARREEGQNAQMDSVAASIILQDWLQQQERHKSND